MKKYNKPELIEMTSNTAVLYCQANGSAAVQPGCGNGDSLGGGQCKPVGAAADKTCNAGDNAYTNVGDVACVNGKVAMSANLKYSCGPGTTTANTFCNNGKGPAGP